VIYTPPTPGKPDYSAIRRICKAGERCLKHRIRTNRRPARESENLRLKTTTEAALRFGGPNVKLRPAACSSTQVLKSAAKLE